MLDSIGLTTFDMQVLQDQISKLGISFHDISRWSPYYSGGGVRLLNGCTIATFNSSGSGYSGIGSRPVDSYSVEIGILQQDQFFFLGFVPSDSLNYPALRTTYGRFFHLLGNHLCPRDDFGVDGSPVSYTSGSSIHVKYDRVNGSILYSMNQVILDTSVKHISPTLQLFPAVTIPTVEGAKMVLMDK